MITIRPHPTNPHGAVVSFPSVIPPRLFRDMVTTVPHLKFHHDQRAWFFDPPLPRQDEAALADEESADQEDDQHQALNDFFAVHTTPIGIVDYRTTNKIRLSPHCEGEFEPERIDTILEDLTPFRNQLRELNRNNMETLQEWLKFQPLDSPVWNLMEKIGVWYVVGFSSQRPQEEEDPLGITFVRSLGLVHHRTHQQIMKSMASMFGADYREQKDPIIETRWLHDVENLKGNGLPLPSGAKGSWVYQHITDVLLWELFVMARYYTNRIATVPFEREGQSSQNTWISAEDAAYLIALLFIMTGNDGKFTKSDYTTIPFDHTIPVCDQTIVTTVEGESEPATTQRQQCQRHVWQRISPDHLIAPDATYPQQVNVDLVNQQLMTAIVLPAQLAKDFEFTDSVPKNDILIHASVAGTVKRLLGHFRDSLMNGKRSIQLRVRSDYGSMHVTASRDPQPKVYTSAQITIDTTGITHMSVSHHRMFTDRIGDRQSFIHTSPINKPNLRLFERQLEQGITIPFSDSGIERLWDLGIECGLIERIPCFNTYAWAVNATDESQWASVIIAVAQGKSLEDVDRAENIQIEGEVTTSAISVDEDTEFSENGGVDDDDDM